MRTSFSKKDVESKASRDARLRIRNPEKTEDQGLGEQILKYIPAEVVAFYIPALTAAATLKQTSAGAQSTSYNLVVDSIFLLAFFGTFVYIYIKAKEDLAKQGVDFLNQRSFFKASISTFAFLIWAIYLGGPFAGIEGYTTYGTLAILGFTFLTPAIYNLIPIPFPGTKPKQNPEPTTPTPPVQSVDEVT